MEKFLLNSILIILLILSIVLTVVNYNDINNSSYIILDKNNVWKVRNNNIVKTNNRILRKLSYSPATIQLNNYEQEGFYEYELTGNAYYDNNLLKTPSTYNSLIVIGNIKIKSYNSIINNEINENDKEIIDNILKLKQIKGSSNDMYVEKAILQENKMIYSVQSLSSNEKIPSFSMIFEYSNENYNMIYFKKLENAELRLSSLYNIVQINNASQKDLILISDISGSAGKECYSFYKYNNSNKNYIPIIDCEE